MHSAATLLLAVLAAEKSKVGFYVAGGLLTAWAIIVSLGLGLRRAEFPGSLGGERVVIAITLVLVAGAISTAVITSSSPAKSGVASAASTTPGTTAAPPSSTPAPPSESTSATAPAPSAKKPAGKHRAKATTGAPTPPSSPASAAPSAIALAADPNGGLSFDKKQLSAKAGTVTIAFANSSTLEHNVTVTEGSKVLGATPSFMRGSKTVTLTLKAGTYTFYCSVPGHRQGGMEGTLSVA